MNDRKNQAMNPREAVEMTVSTELNGLEKRFTFTHSRGGNFGVSGGAVIGTVAVAATLAISDPLPNPAI
jgi:hypothetical protein